MKSRKEAGPGLLAEQFDLARLEAFYRDPSSHAWQIELEFLEQRARQLAIGQPRVGPTRSADRERFLVRAIAGVCQGLAAGGAIAGLHGSLGRSCSTAVVRPRLTVLLHAPLEALLARIRARGRRGEELLTIEHLRRIEHALENQAAAAEGPVLRLDALDKKAAVVELAAAVEAMRYENRNSNFEIRNK